MWHAPNHPARQLKSVAARFLDPLAPRAHPFRPPAVSRRREAAPRAAESEDRQRSALEAVLLLAHQPLTSRKIASLSHLADGTAARTMIRKVNQSLDRGGRAFRCEEVAGGYQLLTRPQFAPWIRRMAGAPAELRMSAPAMETLAVVAYRQPVLRAEIETVRGVQCGEILRQLMERGMVRIAGRADELGRPFLYGTTRKFLQVMGLRNLDELPRASMLRRHEEASDDHAGSTTVTAEADRPEGDDQHDKERNVTTGARTIDPESAGPDNERRTALAGQSRDEAFDDVLDDEDLDDDEYDDDLDDDDDEEEDDVDDDLEDQWEEVEDDDLDDDEDDWDDEDDEDDDWDDDGEDDWEEDSRAS